MLICRATIILQRPSIMLTCGTSSPTLPSNDFNILFQHLQEQLKVMENGWNLIDEEEAGLTSCNLFASVAPGSFYGSSSPLEFSTAWSFA